MPIHLKVQYAAMVCETCRLYVRLPLGVPTGSNHFSVCKSSGGSEDLLGASSQMLWCEHCGTSEAGSGWCVPCNHFGGSICYSVWDYFCTVVSCTLNSCCWNGFWWVIMLTGNLVEYYHICKMYALVLKRTKENVVLKLSEEK